MQKEQCQACKESNYPEKNIANHLLRNRKCSQFYLKINTQPHHKKLIYCPFCESNGKKRKWSFNSIYKLEQHLVLV